MKFNLKKYNRNTLGGVLIHFFLAIFILILLCIFYFYAYLPNTTNHGITITVPDVEGQSIEKAGKFLDDHELRYEVSDSLYSSEYPPLTVLKQIPAAGAKVKQNRKIYLSINRIKPPTVPMPNLVDGSLVNAEAVLKGSELKRGRIQLVSGPFLNVVKEMKYDGVNIAPGTRIPKGSVIDLVVMDGDRRSWPTPNVVGQELEDAKFLLFGYNLNIEIEVQGDTIGVTPIVLKQKPEPSENISVGEIVKLWVGKPGTSMDETPDAGGNEDDNENDQ
jgi:eukaryotic-like serine/threonine-protein kinase